MIYYGDGFDDDEKSLYVSVMEFFLGRYKETLFQSDARLFLHSLIREQGSFIQATSVVLPVGEPDLRPGMEFLESLLARNPAALRCRDVNGDMPVHLAVPSHVNARTVAFLVEWDAEPLGIPDKSGNLPVHIFCSSPFLRRPGLFKLLLDQGGGAALLGSRNANGYQPLHLLVQNTSQHWECLELVKYILLSNGDCVSTPTLYGDLPVLLAAEFCSLDIIFEILRAHPEALLPEHP